MFSADCYRAKAAKYRKLLADPHLPAEALDFRSLEQTYRTLAENEEWLTRNADKIVQRSQDDASEDDRCQVKKDDQCLVGRTAQAKSGN
jgi:hypothetical protein